MNLISSSFLSSKMKFSLICLFIINNFQFGQHFHLSDEEVLSEITFANKSYAEFRFLSSNQWMNVWLKPYSSDENVINEKCVFNGQVVSDDVKGTVILSVCGERITGLFDLNGTLYSLNTHNSWNSTFLGTDSAVDRRRRSLSANVLSRMKQDSDDIAICGNSLPDIDRALDRARGYELGTDKPDEFFGKATIRLSTFIDEMLFKHRFNGNMTEAKQFVAINIAFLQKQLHEKNILRNVDFKVVVVHFSIAPFYLTHHWDIVTYQRTFCRWVRDNTTFYSHVNILFAGSSLWWVVDGEISTRIRGMASVGQLCHPRYSCMIIEAREGFKSVRVLVHEFGHNIGAQHDGNPEMRTEACDGDSYIMSWAVGNGKTSWSECSVKLIRLLLLSMKRDESSKRLKCLKRDAKPMDSDLDITKRSYRKPGLRATPDQQCQMVFGPRFSYYYEDQENICLRMRCKDDFYITTTWGAMEGTDCGHNRKCNLDRCRRMPLGDFNKYVKFGSAKLRTKYVTD